MTPEPFDRRVDAKLIASIVAAGSLSFCAVVFETAMNVALPSLMAEFGVGTSTIQWITSGYLLMLSVVIPAFAFLKVRFPLRRLFVTAVALFIAGTVACGTAPVFWVLLAGRLVQGIGSGIAIPLMFSIVVDQVPYEKTGLMMGFASLITSLAPAIGPSFGGLVIGLAGWRAVFLSMLPLLVASFVAGTLCVRQATALERRRFDAVGYVLVAVGFFSLVYAINCASETGWASVTVLGLMVLAVVSLAVFAWRSLHTDDPLIDVTVFRVPAFTTSVLAFACIAFSILGFAYLVPNYAQLALGEGAFFSGTLLLPGCLATVLVAPLGGRLLDGSGPEIPMTMGVVLMVASCALFAVLGTVGLTAWAMMGVYVLFGVGQGFAFSTIMTNGLRQLPESQRSDGNAVFNTFQQLGGSIGVSVLTTVVGAAQIGAHDMAAATVAGGQGAFFVLTGVSAAIALLVLATFAFVQKKSH